ncbi:hypothetical protein mRhiFer1_008146 [Rhinolophus ferrumequinum]|uniref:Uncharacterized protein n=1 Tax=Rhinolophus ferrumequinum TaxID=59479 RepID=A0A7J7W7V7_RHIFE|nr:hypothetical protein mRhiFer1_008146 [Rhinolophus ferrumequinum]
MPQKSVTDTYGYVSPIHSRIQKTQLMWLQVPQTLETHDSSSSLRWLQAWWGKTGKHLTRRSYQSLDSVRAESEEGRLGAKLLGRVKSHDHHGMSKEFKRSSFGLGWGQGLRSQCPSRLGSLLGKEVM